MELPDVLLTFRQASSIEFASTYNLHTPTRSSQEAQHRLRQFLSQLSDFHGFLIRLQVVYLQHHESVITDHPPLTLPVLIVSSKTDAWQADTAFPLCRHLSVGQPVGIHQVIHLAGLFHSMVNEAIPDGSSQISQLHTVNHLFTTVFLQ